MYNNNDCNTKCREYILENIKKATDNQIMQMLFELYEAGLSDGEFGITDYEDALKWAATGTITPNNDGRYHIT